jgi:hypothetical protein
VAGNPVPLYPPGTSAIFAIGWFAGQGSYRVLNAEVVAFALGSTVVCFLLLRDSLGSLGSGFVVLLCLGSLEFFRDSEFLLSDVLYLFFSMLALWLYQKGSSKGTSMAVLACSAVRMVGFVVAAAFIFDYLVKRDKRRGLAVTMIVVIALVGLWEVRNSHLGSSYTGHMMQNLPFVPSEGYISAGGMLRRLAGNLKDYQVFQALLTNEFTKKAWPLVVLGPLMLLGLWRAAARGQSVLVIYFLLYLGIVEVYYPWIESRWLLPVLPLLFAFLVAGVQAFAETVSPKWLYPAFTLFAIFFLHKGFHEAAAAVPDERGSPFTNQAVKYPDNYDLQRLALWWKDHATREEKYACLHPLLVGVITGTVGAEYPFTTDPDELERELRRQKVHYVLMDLNSRMDREILLVAIEKSGRFRLVKSEATARLYEFAP